MNNNGYVAISRTCIELFPENHTGKLIAVYLVFVALGKIYFAGLMELFFPNDLAGFFLSSSIVSGILYLACFAFLYPFATNKGRQLEIGNEESHDSGNCANATDTSSKDMLRSPFFHAMFWSSVCFFSTSWTYLTNITLLAQSMGIDEPLHSVYIVSVTIMAGRIISGVIFDKFESQWCGYILLMVAYSAMVICMVICLFFLKESNVIIITILIGIAHSPGIVTPIAILIKRFGRSHYSAVIGCFYSVACAFEITLQVIIGYFYDVEIKELGLDGRTCYGRHCFYWPCCIVLGMTLAICSFQTSNYCLSSNYTKTNKLLTYCCQQQENQETDLLRSLGRELKSNAAQEGQG